MRTSAAPWVTPSYWLLAHRNVPIHYVLFIAILLVMLFALSWGAEHGEFVLHEDDELAEMFYGLVEDYDEVEHELTTDY